MGRLLRDSAGNLYTDSHTRRKLRYAAISDTIRPNPGNISDRIPVPREILDRYLQTPPEDPRVSDLAGQITRKAADKFSKAKALEQYLQSNFGYSLVLRGTPNNKDPLATFLFDVRAGHCEYFASSMAIMLRQLGIPSRLVNGFRAGEYNRIGGNWTVRQYHAHSWVEAYFPPYGWVEFDPTPAAPGQAKTGLFRLISDLTDAVDLWWWEGVLNYDSSKQYRVLSVLQAALEKNRQAVAGFFERLYERGSARVALASARNAVSDFGKGWIVCAALAPLAILILTRRWRRRLLAKIERAWQRRSPSSVATSFFAEALGLLSDRGFNLERGQTAMEFARSLKGKPPCDPFLALAEMYYSTRFGRSDMPFKSAEAQTQLRRLRDSLRKT
ncbi:MAG: transglutaminase-like protein [Acidobacteria bacterium]|nr:transglutaminase-like protein [Acidobacteriota bacterium]